jgi:16S rRNA (cytosine1402-N4)-methyltransferase
LTREVLAFLAPERGGVFMDCTVGTGRSFESAARSRRHARDRLDRDPAALGVAARTLDAWSDRVDLRALGLSGRSRRRSSSGESRASTARLPDLGMSSLQLEAEGRGFSFQREDPLDMRMDTTTGVTAADLLRDAEESEIADAILPLRRRAFLTAHRRAPSSTPACRRRS